jgi:hypothetical protein
MINLLGQLEETRELRKKSAENQQPDRNSNHIEELIGDTRALVPVVRVEVHTSMNLPTR